MKKNVYSLVLMESVVNEIDKLAIQENTNRSNLINQILADYVSLTTPEKRIGDILKSLQDTLTQSGIFDMYAAPHDYTLSLKSPLSYKYRPTIKYEVELYRTAGACVGNLKVIYRTQYAQLLMQLMEFFNLFIDIESHYLNSYALENVKYSMDDTKFTRTIIMPNGETTDENGLPEVLSKYILTLDELIKGYISGRLDEADVEKLYVLNIAREKIII